MSEPNHWLLGGWYYRWLIVHQLSFFINIFKLFFKIPPQVFPSDHTTGATIAAGTANLSKEHECFVDHCLSYCAFSSDNCFVWRLTYDFWLDLWYCQTFKTNLFRVFFLNSIFHGWVSCNKSTKKTEHISVKLTNYISG
jgi:hypothetical protein